MWSELSSFEEVQKFARRVGYPVLVRAAFALGGLGSGFANNEKEYRQLAEYIMSTGESEDGENQTTITISTSLRGWKEVEYEIVRDAMDNCISVCNMENIDPVGIHTGDSIVVSPSLTLNNNEYFKLRKSSIKIARYLNILGECNVQFALDEIFAGEEVNIILPDDQKKPGVVHVENGNQDTQAGRMYRAGVGIDFATRSFNGNSNDRFGNIGDWSVDFVVSEKTPQQAAEGHGGFQESGHPLYSEGDGNWSMISEGLGAIGWGSFAANAYNRASGLGSVSLGFTTLAGPQVGASGGPGDYGNVGQFSAGFASRAIGNISTATGFRNTASGNASVALGNYNYATGDSSIALGKENWAQGGSTVAIGFKNHAAGGGSMALGQENIAWGTTNFTSGYQNVAGDITSAIGVAGSATALGHGTFAQGRSSFSANKFTPPNRSCSPISRSSFFSNSSKGRSNFFSSISAKSYNSSILAFSLSRT